MRDIVVSQTLDCEHLHGEFLDESYYDELIDDSCNVYDGDNLAFVFIKNALPLEVCKSIWPIAKKIRVKTLNRGTACGAPTKEYRRADGSKSNTLVVPKDYSSISSIVGFFDRYPRTPYCRKCAWNEKHPEEFEEVVKFTKKVSDVHAIHEPVSYKVLNDLAKKTSKDFIIKDSVYTTITVNHNFRTACHRDPKNLPTAMAAMAYLRQGNFKGGDLIFPELKKAVKMNTGDLIIFKNEKYYHANTRIKPLSSNYDRCTMVFYYRAQMVNCGTAEEELELAKNRKPKEALY